jgi:hypothetical protein
MSFPASVQRSVTEIHPVQTGTLEWTISDFITNSKFPDKNSDLVSSIFAFAFEGKTLQLQLEVGLNDERFSDDDIGLYLLVKNQDKLNIEYQMKALDASDTPFATRRVAAKFHRGRGRGCSRFLSMKNLRENEKDRLPGGALKIRVVFTVYSEPVSRLIKEDSEPKIGSTRGSGLATLGNKVAQFFSIRK